MLFIKGLCGLDKLPLLEGCDETDQSLDRWDAWLGYGVKGVAIPDAAKGDDVGLPTLRASLAARRRRLVVPRSFVVPDRAEQTIATRC